MARDQAGTRNFNAGTWVADTGASTHIGHVCEGMHNIEEIDDPIMMGHGKTTRAIRKGSLPRTALQANGDTIDVALHDYKCAPDMDVNLFSLMKATSSGWAITNKGTTLYLTKGKDKICFDRLEKTKDGLLVGLELLSSIDERAMATQDVEEEEKKDCTMLDSLKCNAPEKKEEPTEQEDKNPKNTDVCVDVNRLHRTLGHASEDALRRTAKQHG